MRETSTSLVSRGGTPLRRDRGYPGANSPGYTAAGDFSPAVMYYGSNQMPTQGLQDFIGLTELRTELSDKPRYYYNLDGAPG